MSSVPKYQPGQKVTANYGEGRIIGRVVKIEPGSDPLKYTVSLTQTYAS